jgi:hypothetical protein
LAREDARQIVENMTGFFSILLEWEAQDREARKAASGAGAQITDSDHSAE